MTTWTYEGYWHAVLGLGTAAQVVAEFELVSDGLDEWLGNAEEAAISAGNVDHDATLEAWAGFHKMALAELASAAEDAASVVPGVSYSIVCALNGETYSHAISTRAEAEQIAREYSAEYDGAMFHVCEVASSQNERRKL